MKERECKICDAIYTPELDLDDGGLYCDGCIKVGLEIEDLQSRLDLTESQLAESEKALKTSKEVKEELLEALKKADGRLSCPTYVEGVGKARNIINEAILQAEKGASNDN